MEINHIHCIPYEHEDYLGDKEYKQILFLVYYDRPHGCWTISIPDSANEWIIENEMQLEIHTNFFEHMRYVTSLGPYWLKKKTIQISDSRDEYAFKRTNNLVMFKTFKVPYSYDSTESYYKIEIYIKNKELFFG